MRGGAAMQLQVSAKASPKAKGRPSRGRLRSLRQTPLHFGLAERWWGAAPCSPSTAHFANCCQSFREYPLVEVAGIEPASASAEPGLLRVQPAVVFLGPSDLAGVSLPG